MCTKLVKGDVNVHLLTKKVVNVHLLTKKVVNVHQVSKEGPLYTRLVGGAPVH